MARSREECLCGGSLQMPQLFEPLKQRLPVLFKLRNNFNSLGISQANFREEKNLGKYWICISQSICQSAINFF